MKDDQTTRILLEGLTADAGAILKIVSRRAAEESSSPGKLQGDRAYEALQARVEKMNELLEEIVASKPSEAEQQRYINLRILLDRIWRRIDPGENLLLHYFTPMRIFIHTLAWILVFFVLGALADKLYSRYKTHEIEVITNQSISQ